MEAREILLVLLGGMITLRTGVECTWGVGAGPGFHGNSDHKDYAVVRVTVQIKKSTHKENLKIPLRDKVEDQKTFDGGWCSLEWAPVRTPQAHGGWEQTPSTFLNQPAPPCLSSAEVQGPVQANSLYIADGQHFTNAH